MILTIAGTILLIIGSMVSIVFWIPGIFNRAKVKELMGKRYSLVYVVYVANGPLLMLFGVLLLVWAKVQR